MTLINFPVAGPNHAHVHINKPQAVKFSQYQDTIRFRDSHGKTLISIKTVPQYSTAIYTQLDNGAIHLQIPTCQHEVTTCNDGSTKYQIKHAGNVVITIVYHKTEPVKCDICGTAVHHQDYQTHHDACRMDAWEEASRYHAARVADLLERHGGTMVFFPRP